MKLSQSIIFICCACQLISSLEIEKLFHRQKRQLDWNNGVDYQFDHVAISSNRHIRRDDDGSDNANVVDEASSGANTPEGVPGEPGVDYPILPSIPLTNFHCRGRVPGYYGDTETACQVFHVCDVSGRQDSFLCPNGTIFSQKLFSCDWWYNVQCATSRQHYQLNQNLYKGSEINLYGTPSFWNWLTEVDEEEPNTERDGPARPDEIDDTPETGEELPVAQPLAAHPPHATRQQHDPLLSVAPATPRPVLTTSTLRPVLSGGWIPLASTRPSTTSTPKPVVAIKQVDSVARKRSPTKSTQPPESVGATPSADEWWNTGFMRDYRLPNFGWARENLFPAGQGTTPELSWMDIGPNGPLMADYHGKLNTRPTIASHAQTNHGPNTKQTGRQEDGNQQTQSEAFRSTSHAPKQIQQQKVAAKPQVAQQRPIAQPPTRPAQQLPAVLLATANHVPNHVNKQSSQALKAKQITTVKPNTITAVPETRLDFFNDGDSTVFNDDGQTTLQKHNIQVVGKFKKPSSSRKSFGIPSSPIAETKQRNPLSSIKPTGKRVSVTHPPTKSTNTWLQQPLIQTTQKRNSRASNATTKTALLQTTHARIVQSDKPVRQPDIQISRKHDPFAGIVMERVAAPFRPSAPISIVPPAAPAQSSRQQIARSSSVPLADARPNGPARKKSRSPNAYDPRLDRPYRQEHPIWKMLNWESTRM